MDELERLRNELALRDATIAAERAKNEALEMRMQLKAREDEIAKLRAEIAGSATTSDRTMTKTSTGAIAPVIGTTKQPVVAQTKAPSESNGQRPVVGSASKRAAGASNKRPSTNAEKQQHVVKKTTNKRKQEAAPLEVVEDPGTESMHQKTKFRKTTNVVRAKDGSFIRVRIPGIMFCNRCKRTNVPPDNAAFDPEYPGTCLPCKERIKVLTELNKGVSKSPKKILQHKLPPVGPDGKRRLLNVEREAKWRNMVLANISGSVETCEKLRIEMIQDKKRYTNSVNWDEEFIQVAAGFSRHPIRMISWALSNAATIDERAAKNACERKETDKTTPLNDEPYTSGVRVLRHLFKCGCQMSCDVIHAACAFGNLECVKFLKKHVRMCDFQNAWFDFKRADGEDNELMLIAAQEGQVDVLEYLYEHDCDFSVEDANTCLELAKIRKPRAGNYDKVVAYIKSLPEWAEYTKTVEVKIELN